MHVRLILLTAAAAATVVVAQDCYYPEGNKATDYDFQPCGGENTTFASCCYFGEGDICLGNGLCSYVGHYDYRAACADQSWEKCQNPCPSVIRDSWVQVKQCAQGEYCCNSDIDNGDCCTDDSRRFDLETSTPTSAVSSTSAPSSTAAQSSTTAPSSASSSPPESTTGAPAATESSSNDDDGGGGGGMSPGTQGAIGGSIGGVAAIGIAGAAWFLLRRRRSRKQSQGASSSELEGEGPGKTYWGGQVNGPTAGGGLMPAEIEGSQVPVESDSTEKRVVHEMAG